jgi:hypothetical protein
LIAEGKLTLAIYGIRLLLNGGGEGLFHVRGHSSAIFCPQWKVYANVRCAMDYAPVPQFEPELNRIYSNGFKLNEIAIIGPRLNSPNHATRAAERELCSIALFAISPISILS